ncbi:hypothetical protein FRACYDRAFT_236628 [Fragilariopsis cylindrus CCMP1102]|uniref:Mitochondrial inner membrane protease ATP23 n=1 Tax=Fragilariopsis cylindrus CCMP1102 TaxID=635003 RepID=A0A1E7FJJ7_9STRA|nr:hypothetical protein FRACYDRAFT_236628 [Fragilariopsis cylindrus CCMP1102]|eukprot:OEU18351.1 hypothetical protein FRACYDRAFT_236628 [Fragilariopsis cylindrus CCMP1102]
MTITNSLARSSCTKCVEVLQELVSGLQQDNAGENNNNYNTNKSNSNSNSNTKNEPPPLTLLKAIARSSHQQRNDYDQWGQQQRRRRDNNNRRNHHQHQHRHQQQHNNKPKKSEKLKIEEIENGIRLIIPVETTSPTLMKRWTQLVQIEEKDVNVRDNDNDTILIDGTTLATSIRIQNNNNNVVNYDNGDNNDNDGTTVDSSLNNDDTTTIDHLNDDTIIHNPLTIELHCRKCASTGPEAGARAFLMGPEPLSIVLCHNRINSDVDEIEEILTHELTHLYDVQTLQLDLTDCETVAYSEVRAAREAECSKYITNHRRQQNQQNQNQQQESNSNNKKNSNGNGIDTILPSIITESWSKAQHSYCVKNIALGAIQNMFPQRGVGKQCLNKVWEKAYKDHRPFNTTDRSTNTQRQQSRQQQQNNNNGREDRKDTAYNNTNTNYYKSSSSGTTTSHAGNVASGK